MGKNDVEPRRKAELRYNTPCPEVQTPTCMRLTMHAGLETSQTMLAGACEVVSRLVLAASAPEWDDDNNIMSGAHRSRSVTKSSKPYLTRTTSQ